MFSELLNDIGKNCIDFQFQICLQDISDLKFIFLFKFGYTFFETCNFFYIDKIPENFRTLKDTIEITSKDLSTLNKKYNTNFNSNKLSALIFELETKFDSITILTIIENLLKQKKILNQIPTNMIC